MSTSLPQSGTEHAVIRRLRTAAAAQCARTRMPSERRDLLRDALVTEAERRWSEDGHAVVLTFPWRRTDRALATASA